MDETRGDETDYGELVTPSSDDTSKPINGGVNGDLRTEDGDLRNSADKTVPDSSINLESSEATYDGVTVPVSKTPLYAALSKRHLASEEMTTADVSRILDEDLEGVLSEMPRIAALPSADELTAVLDTFGHEQIVLEGPVTINDLRRHLAGATPDTPEIGIDVFNNNLYVMTIGTPYTVPQSVIWPPFEKIATLDFHTHPDPTEPQLMRNPSPDGDMHRASLPGAQAALIGSTDGITLYGPIEKNAQSLQQYITETRGFDIDSYEVYGADVVFDEFMRDVVRPTYLSWAELDGNMTLQDALHHLRRKAA